MERTRYYRLLVGLLLLAQAACAPTPAPLPPDFNGVWARDPDPYETAEGDPPLPGGEPQLKGSYADDYHAYATRRLAGENGGAPVIDDSTRCRPEGMPTIMGAVYPIEIVQTSKMMVVLAELFTQTRRIFLNETMPSLDDITPSYNGYSVARFEGKTLVVETLGVREDVRFSPFGIPHSVNMTIVERMELQGTDRLLNHITITDPEALNQPYVFTFEYKRKPDYKVMEYICDNNRSEVDGQGVVHLDMELKQSK